MNATAPKDSRASEVLVRSYANLNSSFRNRLVFKLTNSGLFSEINNLLLGVLYCLENRLQFTLSSNDFALAPFDGWAEYFLPFCSEAENATLDFFNWRHLGKWSSLESYGRTATQPLLWRSRFFLFNYIVRPIRYGDTRLLTAEFVKIRRLRHLGSRYYEFPALGISGGLLEALHRLSAIVWRYQNDVGDEIQTIVSGLGLPRNYVGLHVRRGDKIEECSLFDERQYLELVGDNTGVLDVFVLADDYFSVERIRNLRPSWRIFTLADPAECGYDNRVFLNASPEFIRSKTLRLLAAVEVLCNARNFVGMYKANLSSFVALRRNGVSCSAVDAGTWSMS